MNELLGAHIKKSQITNKLTLELDADQLEINKQKHTMI